MDTSLSVFDFWPHGVLVAVLATAGLRVSSRPTLLSLAVAFAAVALGSYWLLDNGIAPPPVSKSVGQLFALGLAGLVPLVATAEMGRALHLRRVTRLKQVASAIVVGLILTVCIPGFQLFFICSFSVCL